MQFLVIAYDGTDAQAPARRMAAREAHLNGVRRLLAEKKHLYGGAMIDETGNMYGSAMIVDYPDKQTLEEEWLKSEPYVTAGVWKEIEIKPIRVPDFFFAQQ